MNKILSCLIVLLLSSSVFPHQAGAQAGNNLEQTILKNDSIFWVAYNNCDIEKMGQFFTDDLEFYHDKGGISTGLAKMLETTKQNLCGSNDIRLRREAVKGTVAVFAMANAGNTYGAVISGEHVFYIIEKGQKEKVDGLAKFTHLWVLKDNKWKMSRILSYDHGPASRRTQEIKVEGKILDQLAGNYVAPKTGILQFKNESGALVLIVANSKMLLYPEKENLFFVKDRDLTFEFITNEKGKSQKLRVRENGKIVEEAERQ